MKTTNILLLGLFLIVSIPLNAQNNSEKKAKKNITIQDSLFMDNIANNIEIDVDMIIPNNARIIHTSDGYYLKIKNDSLDCYLPYYGESRGYVNPTELRIEIKDYKLEIKRENPKNGVYIIKFTGKSLRNTEIFDFTITIFDSLSCTISVMPSSRTFISYQGTLKLNINKK